MKWPGPLEELRKIEVIMDRYFNLKMTRVSVSTRLNRLDTTSEHHLLQLGAEECSLVGSYEWVEQHGKGVANRAVAYLNVDIAVEGDD